MRYQITLVVMPYFNISPIIIKGEGPGENQNLPKSVTDTCYC